MEKLVLVGVALLVLLCIGMIVLSVLALFNVFGETARNVVIVMLVLKVIVDPIIIVYRKMYKKAKKEWK